MYTNISTMTTIDARDIATFLGKIDFFSELRPESRKALGREAEQITFRARQRIFDKGTPGDSLYAIYKGKVIIHDEDHEYDRLEAGECFGEYAMIDREARSASVTAEVETVVFRISHDVFITLMQNDPGFARGILKVMIDRHRQLDTIQEELASSKKALEEVNERMDGLINGAMDSILLFDQKYRILLANPAALDMLENQDVIQRNILFFLDDAHAGMVEELTTRLADNHHKRMFLPSPVKVIGSGGKETLYEVCLICLGNVDNILFILILRNIQDRLEAEDRIDQLTSQTRYLQQELDQVTEHAGIIAGDPAMQKVLSMIRQVAVTDATVLIHGETGTGKELVAKAIHEGSPRKEKPFIRINCGAIPGNLIESELFGHEKGAFTGATASRKGRFLLADKGTLFLDEIGELPLELQPKLLRAIQEGEFDPVGSNTTQKVDVRILAATHRDLQALSHEGKFREDLFYRLNVFPLSVPPLRDRGDDICLIADELIRRYARKFGKTPLHLSEADKELFKKYHWPGNVRELQNLVERAMIIATSDTLHWRSILPAVKTPEAPVSAQTETAILTADELAHLEKENLLRALRRTKWKVSGKNGAAAMLGIPPTTLASKIKAFGISRPV